MKPTVITPTAVSTIAQRIQAAIDGVTADALDRNQVCAFAEFDEASKRSLAASLIHQLDDDAAAALIGEGIEAIDDGALLVVTRQESPDFYEKLYDAIGDLYESAINTAIASYYRDQWRNAEISIATKRMSASRWYNHQLREAM